LHISFEGEVLDGTSNPDNCTLELAVTDQNHYRLFGCYHHQSAPSTLNIAISNQKEYAREVVKILARKFSMSKVEFSKSPQSATLIASHRSEPLPALLKKMMVSSDNQIADALVKAMTFKHYNKAASWSMVKRFFSECLPPEISGRHQVVLADGAGLSVQNKITAAFMGDLLKAIYNNPKTLQLFMQSAPHNHKINSPLHERLSGLTHRIYGKTGYINYSSGLIGIVAPPDSPEEARFGFVIYTNNNTGNYRQMKNFEDAWLEEMLSRKIAK
jgi:D-alanyl-D-alanine carboxypeptidase/D-alanyl-D-alanine-endopeptidase (penicillin-binding protein 4)